MSVAAELGKMGDFENGFMSSFTLFSLWHGMSQNISQELKFQLSPQLSFDVRDMRYACREHVESEGVRRTSE